MKWNENVWPLSLSELVLADFITKLAHLVWELPFNSCYWCHSMKKKRFFNLLMLDEATNSVSIGHPYPWATFLSICSHTVFVNYWHKWPPPVFHHSSFSLAATSDLMGSGVARNPHWTMVTINKSYALMSHDILLNSADTFSVLMETCHAAVQLCHKTHCTNMYLGTQHGEDGLKARRGGGRFLFTIFVRMLAVACWKLQTLWL